jgi:hypothetical protein
MGNLRIKDIPDDLNERLRRMVAEKNCTIKSVVIDALEREFSKWELDKHREWLSKASQEDIEEYYRKRGPVRVIQFELDEPNNAVRVIEFTLEEPREVPLPPPDAP